MSATHSTLRAAAGWLAACFFAATCAVAQVHATDLSITAQGVALAALWDLNAEGAVITRPR